ncbi:MAG: hypothetical protein M1820_010755 [Bogoriella megaspora]|nr:MAG: hypothetical protein M1820_010755 [Bogoriella megaspora]
MWPIDYWNLMDQKQREIARKFTLDLQSVLGVQLIEFSLKHEWQRTPPEDAGDQSLDDYMLKAYMWYDDYHAFDDFQEVFWAKHQRAPYLTPPTREAWDSCKIISKASGDEAARRVHIFRTWFHSTFFVDGQPLFILPLENVAPRYRDDPPE